MTDQSNAEPFANHDEGIPVLLVPASDDGSLSSDSERTTGKRNRSPLSKTRIKEKLQDVSDKKAEKASAATSSIQDRLFSKLLQQVIPSDSDDVFDIPDKRSTAYVNRPGFSLPLMTNNFRRFNARIGVVFVFQTRVIRLLTWVEPTHTLSLLAIFSFLILSPPLLSIVPPAVILLFIMVPAFLARHPPPPSDPLSAYSLHGPALSAARTVKPAPEMSKDFFRNLRDLQNTMADFSSLHDQTVALLAPPTNFSDEALSSSLFLFLTFLTATLFLAAHLVPFRLIFLVSGWASLVALHPQLQKSLLRAHKKHIEPRQTDLWTHIRNYSSLDITMDLATEEREVEIFELQRRDRTDEWEPWVFGPSPHDPLSAERIAGDRPKGARFFEDVAAPRGWTWRDKKWMLDLNSREWVEERMITGVEIEVEGERWVIDTREGEGRETGGGEWEGAGLDERVVLRRGGEWRRRRWVRLVHRRSLDSAPDK